jgi:cytochrome c oxidase subunit 2
MPVTEPVSQYAGSINTLFVIVLIIAAAVFLVVTGLLTFFALRYRARNRTALADGVPPDANADEPEQTFGNRKVEIVWIAIPLVIVLLLFGLAVTVARASDPPSSTERAPDLVVIGHQWWWEVVYPQSGVVTANEIHIPTGRPILLRLESADVIHDFWVPQLGRKMDAIPGQPNQFWISADQPGTYLGACAEFCGLQHAWMRLRVIAQPQVEWDAWLQGQAAPLAVSANGPAQRGLAIFQSRTCANCHATASTADGVPPNARPNVGPNLTHLNTRETIGAGVLDNTPENLARWLNDPEAFKPGSLMPDLNLSDDEVLALVAYLEGQK